MMSEKINKDTRIIKTEKKENQFQFSVHAPNPVHISVILAPLTLVSSSENIHA